LAAQIRAIPWPEETVAAKQLQAGNIGLPRFAVPQTDSSAPPASAFDLSSHERARVALEFGFHIPDAGFNIFVVGQDRSGRMTATLGYLRDHMASLPRASDWIYLNNFARQFQPRPYKLPAGTGRKFRDRMQQAITTLRQALKATFEGSTYQDEISRITDRFKESITAEISALRDFSRQHGLDLAQTDDGFSVVKLGEDGEMHMLEDLSPEERKPYESVAGELQRRMREVNSRTRELQPKVAMEVKDIRRAAADRTVTPIVAELERDFTGLPGLERWIVAFRVDVLEQVDLFLGDDEEEISTRLDRRYGVNLLVDHADDPQPDVVVEPTPSYENLFGTIQYRLVGSTLDTDVTMLRAGALHRANGGVLVLRAEALAREEGVWEFLKGALRDREIRIEERHREGGTPLAAAPRPEPIPLSVKVVIVGAARWYYAFLANDPDFQTYFKVKADIDSELLANEKNIAIYARLLRQFDPFVSDDAIDLLLGQCSRWSEHRGKLTARFEAVEDLIAEARALARAWKGETVTRAYIQTAIEERRKRHRRYEDREQESIRSGQIMIATTGTAIGQINALVVRDLGDFAFGLPARVSARTYVGSLGVINIERQIALGGPIQQKGVMVLEGFLNGQFAHRFPLSFSCSVTFEQSYGGVEGDSASLAEVCAILSSLSGLRLRQDIAVTGSINQFGESQAVGGINQKIEGYFRTCNELGLTGTQGVIIPHTNEQNATLRDDVVEAVSAGRFHIWSVQSIGEAIEILTGVPAGVPDAAGNFPPESVSGRVYARLVEYDRILTERAARRE
jgi:predicted ATP-dependent protease